VILGSSQLLYFRQVNTIRMAVGIVQAVSLFYVLYLACSGTSMSLISWIALVMIIYLAGLHSTVPYRISDVSGVTYSSQGGKHRERVRVCAAVRSRSWKVL
jgi:hypothetical protein